MKKIKLDKLSLKKWAVARLQLDALKHLKGGYDDEYADGAGGTVYGATCGTASAGDGKSCKCDTRSQNPNCATDYCKC